MQWLQRCNGCNNAGELQGWGGHRDAMAAMMQWLQRCNGCSDAERLQGWDEHRAGGGCNDAMVAVMQWLRRCRVVAQIGVVAGLQNGCNDAMVATMQSGCRAGMGTVL